MGAFGTCRQSKMDSSCTDIDAKKMIWGIITAGNSRIMYWGAVIKVLKLRFPSFSLCVRLILLKLDEQKNHHYGFG